MPMVGRLDSMMSLVEGTMSGQDDSRENLFVDCFAFGVNSMGRSTNEELDWSDRS
jgi:hypothetical protein